MFTEKMNLMFCVTAQSIPEIQSKVHNLFQKDKERQDSSLWVSRTGSASDWCALQEALYKCIDTIQYKER